MDAMASRIQSELSGTANPLIELLQVEPRYVFNPTPPTIDIYPADPFTESIGYGPGNDQFTFTVRARVSTAEHEGGQDLLLSMMDPRATTSLSGAIEEDGTLGGVVESLNVTGPTGFGLFPSSGPEGTLLGTTWTVTVIP
jgi:hypothetical protein